MQTNSQRSETRRGPRLGVLISGLGRYGLAGMLTGFDGEEVTLKFARRMRLPTDRVHRRAVRLTVSYRDDGQWHLLDLRAAIEQVDDVGLRLRLDQPLAEDLRTRLQSIVGGAAVAPAPVVALADAATAASPAPATEPGSDFAAAVHTHGQHWLDRILTGIEENMTRRGQRERGAQARMQTQDDIAQLKDLRKTIEQDFRRRLDETISQLDQAAVRISLRESTVDRTLNLLNTARLEDMMGFVDVVQGVETITHPKMLTLCHALTRATQRNVNEDNNPFRVEKMCESALSSILDNWSVAPSNRQDINDALRESAVALGSMYGSLVDVLRTVGPPEPKSVLQTVRRPDPRSAARRASA